MLIPWGAGLNIGTRQNRRLRGTNVIDVAYEEEAIKSAIESQLTNPKNTKSAVYGNGDSGKKIADILATTRIPHQVHR